MPDFREFLQRNRIKVYLVTGLILLAAPLGLFMAASAGNETFCWFFLGIVSAAQAVVISLK